MGSTVFDKSTEKTNFQNPPKENFSKLETEMKEFTIGNLINKLDLKQKYGW